MGTARGLHRGLRPQKYGRKKAFSHGAYRVIMEYDWPGNVWELKNFVERMVLITDVTETEIDHISPEMLMDVSEPPNMPFHAAITTMNTSTSEAGGCHYAGIALCSSRMRATRNTVCQLRKDCYLPPVNGLLDGIQLFFHLVLF